MMRIEKEKITIKLSEFQYDNELQLFRLPEQIRNLEKRYVYSDRKIENYILSVIKNANDIGDDSEELMRLAKDWQSYYHLGAGRSNIIKCLDLKTQINILELGSGCGALTRYLGERFKSVDCVEGNLLRAKITRERCRDLNNVRVFCSDIKWIEFEPNYDVVSLIGALEYAPVYFSNINNKNPIHTLLEIAKTALKPDGVLIIAIENKIGLKYWIGYPEDHSGKVFDGIHSYPGEGGPKTFSKREITELLNQMGFNNIDFYYLFPDYKFTTTVLSDIGDDKSLHLHNWVDVPLKSHLKPGKSTFQIRLVLKTISDAGLLREFANSFLIAARNDSDIINKPDWAAKKFTMSRLKKFHCITTLKLTPNTSVEKIRLNKCKDKINVGIIKSGDCQFNISHNISNSKWHKGDSLSLEVYRGLHKEDFAKEVSNILQRYYQKLYELYYIGKNDVEGYPLLQGCAFDILLRNIIVNDLNELIPFDHEWQAETSIPADYVIYRCIINDIVNIGSNKIGNLDKFIINLQKTLFPQYEINRNNRNQNLEKSFHSLVTNNINCDRFFTDNRFLPIIQNKIVWNVVITVWNNMPISVKKLIKYIMRI